jgi:uncharacterized delta-60 repeat protein
VLGKAFSIICSTILLGGAFSVYGRIAFDPLSGGNFSGSESGGPIPVTLIRTGDVSQGASVEFEITFEGALAAEDIRNPTGKAEFAPGETRKTFGVEIIRDGLLEGTEWFDVRLKNAAGDVTDSAAQAHIGVGDGEKPVVTDLTFRAQTSNNYLRGAAELPDGSVLIAGAFQTLNRPVSVKKFDAEGEEDFSFVATGFYADSLTEARELEDGSILIAGDFGMLGIRAPLLRLSPQGDLVKDYELREGSFLLGFQNGANAILSDGRRVFRITKEGVEDETFHEFAPANTWMPLGAVGENGLIYVVCSQDTVASIVRLTAEGELDASFKEVRGRGFSKVAGIGSGVVAYGGFEKNGGFAEGLGSFDAAGGARGFVEDPSGRLKILATTKEGIYVSGRVGGHEGGMLRVGSNLVVDRAFVFPAEPVWFATPAGERMYVGSSSGGQYVVRRILLTNATLRGVEFSAKDYWHPEGGEAEFAVRRIGDTSQELTVKVSAKGTVTGAIEFQEKLITLRFEPLQEEVSARLMLPGDDLPKRDQLVGLRFEEMSGAVAGANSNALMHIVDDDGRAGELSVAAGEKWALGKGVWFGPSSVHDLIKHPNGNIVAVGALFDPGTSTNPPVPGVMFNHAGEALARVGEGLWGSNYVYEGGAQSDGKIILVGDHYFYMWCVARFNVDGTLDQTFQRPPMSAHEVRHVRVQPDDKILISGSLRDSTVPDDLKRHNFMRLMPDGTKDVNFVVAPEVGGVEGFEIQPDGKVLVFCDTSISPAILGLRLLADGSLDMGFSPLTDKEAQAPVYVNENTWAVQRDGKILAAYEVVDAHGTVRVKIRRFDKNGIDDGSWLGPEAKGGTVRKMLVLANGKVVVGGDFSSIGEVARPGLARLNADGSVDLGFDCGSGVSGVRSMLLLENGDLLVGGGFGDFNGGSCVGVAQIRMEMTPSFRAAKREGGSFQTTLTGYPGDVVEIEKSVDLKEWQPLGTVRLDDYTAGISEEIGSSLFLRAKKSR